MNYRYYGYSFLLHLLVVLAALVNFKYGTGNGTGKVPGKGAGGHSEAQENKRDYSGGDNKRVVEISLSENPGKKNYVPKTYFYGIGVSIEGEMVNDNSAYRVSAVYDSYPGQTAGILLNDIILFLNGEPPSASNDIASESSRVIVLTISRDGRVFDLSIKTEKIYYKD